MCGISGRIGTNVLLFLICDLQKLEYRGYDSAGLGYFENDNIKTFKVKGRVSGLNKVKKKCASIGIAHTRWATHGKPSKANAHPHSSENGNWTIVHNGIIENAKQLKQEFGDEHFKSQTDTEVVAHLLEKYGDGVEAIKAAMERLKGSYAIVALNKAYPDTLFVMKNKSPLYIYQSEGQVTVTSDIITLDTGFYYDLEDGEYGFVTAEKMQIFNQKGKKIKKQLLPIKKDNIILPQKPFKHHMLKEIYDTPTCLQYLIDYYKNHPTGVDFSKYEHIKLVGCGTAYHTALMGVKFFEGIAGVESHAYIASEVYKPILKPNTLCIFISQSGETADTMEVMINAKKQGAETLLITNRMTSTMAKKADIVLPMMAGEEVAVASTKAYTCGVSVLYLLALQAAGKMNFTNLKRLQSEIAKLLSLSPQPRLARCKNVFFIGRGMDDVSAMEGCLKLKEITYINSIAFAAGELKHGTLALIDKHSLVFALNTCAERAGKMQAAIEEVRSRGGKVVELTTLPATNKDAVKFEHIDDNLDGLLIMVYLQLLAYYAAARKGYNPDKPRNLAKSVTVI